MFKGSIWNIWDLHLHTPCSVLNNQFGDPDKDETWEKYVEQIERRAEEKGAIAIGITDYFTIEGYKRLLEFQNVGRLQNILLLPNIEFRVDKIIYRSNSAQSKRLNIHVIISPEIDPADIEENFLHNLDFAYENDPFEPEKKLKLKIPNLKTFGERLHTQHPNFEGQSPLKIGCSTAVVQTEDVKRLLENDDRFKGKYLLILAEEDLSLMDWGSQHHAVRQQLVQMSHAIFSSNGNTRNFCLGKTHPSIDAYLEEFKTLKPCIWGCDSHGFNERFLEPNENRYCWIKGEATWEGLKQILYEPGARVSIQENNPEPSKSIYTIEKMEVGSTQINSMLGISDFCTGLNPNLVAIIGGRGSGKTALLDLIASCFHEGNKLAQMENSFFHRLYVGDGPKKHLNSQPITVTIGFKSGELFQKSIGKDEVCFDKTNIRYLTQSHFDEYSASPDKLYSHIIDLVFEKLVDERRKYEEMEAEIRELEQGIQTKNLDIDQLRSEIAGQKAIEENNKKLKEGERADYVQRIDEIGQKQGGADESILKLTQHLDELKSQQRSIQSLLNSLPELADHISNFKERYGDSVKRINEELTAFLGNELIRAFPVELNDLQIVDTLIIQNTTALDQTDTEIENSIGTAEKEVNELEGIGRVIADLQQKVNEISVEIEDVENRIRDILYKEQKINELDQGRFSQYASLMSKIVGLGIFLQKTINQFELGKDEMLSRLKFSAIIDTRKSRELIETLIEKVDNRSHSEDSLYHDFLPILDDMNALMKGMDPTADFSNIADRIKNFAQGLRRKRSTTESDLYNAVLHRFFEIGLRIEFNNKALTELSMGERAVVLLKIMLALDDKPLLIDQPEEHLDNRYIYNELAPAFRNAKTKRQIIIATHNANLVVNTDAEQIIIAEHTGGKLSYKTGTLEDLEIRESIKSILEGGHEAFRKREEKYGYKF